MDNYHSMVYCTNCGAFTFINSTLNGNSILFRLTNGSIFKILPSSLSSMSVTYQCNSCESHDVVNIDGPIAKAVCRFNELGYTTRYSCAGHSAYGNSYISFASAVNHDENPLTKDQRMAIYKCYHQVHQMKSYERIRDLVTLDYDAFDLEKEEFIDKDIEDENGRLTINFNYIQDDINISQSINFNDYNECRQLFWNMLDSIITLLTIVEAAGIYAI